MNGILNSVWTGVEAIVLPILSAQAIALVAKGIAFLHHAIGRIKNEGARSLVDSLVRGAEQKWGKTISNAEKKQRVLDAAKKALPWMPEAILDLMIEASVAGLLPATS